MTKVKEEHIYINTVLHALSSHLNYAAKDVRPKLVTSIGLFCAVHHVYLNYFWSEHIFINEEQVDGSAYLVACDSSCTVRYERKRGNVTLEHITEDDMDEFVSIVLKRGAHAHVFCSVVQCKHW